MIPGGTEMETVDSGPGAGRDAQGAPPLLEPKPLLHAELGSSVARDASFGPALLAAAPIARQKHLIGEQLYPLVKRKVPHLAEEITGMLLTKRITVRFCSYCDLRNSWLLLWMRLCKVKPWQRRPRRSSSWCSWSWKIWCFEAQAPMAVNNTLQVWQSTGSSGRRSGAQFYGSVPCSGTTTRMRGASRLW